MRNQSNVIKMLTTTTKCEENHQIVRRDNNIIVATLEGRNQFWDGHGVRTLPFSPPVLLLDDENTVYLFLPYTKPIPLIKINGRIHKRITS